jgi:hypothetical protein
MHLRTHKKLDATSSEQNKTIKIKPKKNKNRTAQGRMKNQNQIK